MLLNQEIFLNSFLDTEMSLVVEVRSQVRQDYLFPTVIKAADDLAPLGAKEIKYMYLDSAQAVHLCTQYRFNASVFSL